MVISPRAAGRCYLPVHLGELRISSERSWTVGRARVAGGSAVVSASRCIVTGLSERKQLMEPGWVGGGGGGVATDL